MTFEVGNLPSNEEARLMEKQEFDRLELLDMMVKAPHEEIDGMCSSGEEAAKMFGIPAEDYVAEQHYVFLTANLRRQWALAMIEASHGPIDCSAE
jgi:hypothetical protein